MSRQQIEVNMPAKRVVKALSTGRIARTCEVPADLCRHALISMILEGTARLCTTTAPPDADAFKGQADPDRLSRLASGFNDRLGRDPTSLERLSYQPAGMVEDRQPWLHAQAKEIKSDKDHRPSRKCKAALPAFFSIRLSEKEPHLLCCPGVWLTRLPVLRQASLVVWNELLSTRMSWQPAARLPNKLRQRCECRDVQKPLFRAAASLSDSCDQRDFGPIKF